MKQIALAAAIVLVPSLVFAQGSLYKEQVVLDRLDKASNTYSGRIILSYKTCNMVHDLLLDYNKVATILLFDKAKNAEDAKAQKKADVEKLIAEAAKHTRLCPIE